MHFVGCARPVGTLESAPRAALLPLDLVGATASSDEGAPPENAGPVWESYWDADGRYLVRAVTGSGDAWFALVDEPEATQARGARPTPRAVARVLPVGGAATRGLVFVGARRRGAARGAAAAAGKRSFVLVAKRPARAARAASGI